MKTDLHTGRAVSRLYIANANRHDSGNYTCALGDFAKATVAVHVLNGKYPQGYVLLSFFALYLNNMNVCVCVYINIMENARRVGYNVKYYYVYFVIILENMS